MHQPAEVAYAYEELKRSARGLTIAAMFGNVHGVYKPGNVHLEPKSCVIPRPHVQEKFGTGPNPVDFVFHGGSGSSVGESGRQLATVW